MPDARRHQRALLLALTIAVTSSRSVAEPGEIVLAGAGDRGIFDAALERDRRSQWIWMSYSAVAERVVAGAAIDEVSTRLAVSRDGGDTWHDQSIALNVAQVESNPPPPFAGGASAVWQHEVSRLVFEPRAQEAERWKLFWHRYLLVDDGNALTDDRKFQHGWIGMRVAATPAALAVAPERKLFSGAAYHTAAPVAAYNDAIIGKPEVRLHELDARLADCLAFTEPGATATGDGLYVSLVCGTADPSARRILVLRRSPVGSWEYLGVALDAATAARINARYTGFSAPDLFQRGGRLFLIASPTTAPFDFYGGCFVFRFQSADRAALHDGDADGVPDVLLAVPGDPDGFAGACTFTARSRRSGLVLGRALLAAPLRYHLFKTGLRP